MDIVVKGRNVEVPAHYRAHVAEKLHKVERYDHKLMRVEVELFHERNPRQSDYCQRVEITCWSRGPVVRAEACAPDFYSALDNALAKLDTRLRRAADRRRVHRGRHAPISVAAATASLPTDLFDPAPLGGTGRSNGRVTGSNGRTAGSNGRIDGSNGPVPGSNGRAGEDPAVAASARVAVDIEVDDYQPWHIARKKEHPARPMSVDDALLQMELVGHDFYLFLDRESGKPSVVYRRKGYDYGVICLAA
ncbi:MAG TPA: ribosome-associated translation inhibitor RaiA [Micromonosporaceae bacterium]|nr:ribosome-associated translation inhibitor RaiA [Micromonosporaceae bacterium]